MITVELFISVTSAWLTFTLIKRPNITPTRASTLLSLTGFLIIFSINKIHPFDLIYYSSFVFGASFVGMCSFKVISDFEVILGGIFFALFYVLLVPSLQGIGGALGASAFGSIALSRSLFRLYRITSGFINKRP